MTIMSAKEVKDAAKDDPYMMTAYTETNDFDPRSIVWILLAVGALVGVCLLFSWWFDFVGLSDKIAATVATVEALK